MADSQRKSIVFLSSSYVNLAHLCAISNLDVDVHLVIDKKIPFDFDQELENFYIYTFEKRKIYENSPEKYFDTLAVFINEFEPDLIIVDNFDKQLPESFFDFFKFTHSKISFLLLEHSEGKTQIDVRKIIDEGEFFSNLKLVGKNTIYHKTKATSLKELKSKGLIKSPEELINYRARNVVLLYHEKSKVLGPLNHILRDLFKE
ncbi:MAG: hypothetical protein ACOCXG_05570 [Nanoarchaeota archaeon]